MRGDRLNGCAGQGRGTGAAHVHHQEARLREASGDPAEPVGVRVLVKIGSNVKRERFPIRRRRFD